MSDCIFCEIVAGAIPADVVHQDDHVLAFRDISPQAPTHLVVVPRTHVDTFAGVPVGAGGVDVFGTLMSGARDAAAAAGLTAEDGYRVVVNCGERAAQSVFHLHVHVLGGRVFGWPPG